MDPMQFKKTPIYLGEFREEALEKEFYQAEISRNFNVLRLTILVVAILTFLMIVPEYYIIEDPSDFFAAFIISSFMTAALIILFIKVSKDKNWDSLIYWFTVYEIMIGLSLIYIVSSLMTMDFMIQVISVIVMILLVYLINNRWLYSIFTSLFLSISYFVFVAVFLNNVSTSDYLAAVLFIILIIFICSIASYGTNYYKRFHYLNLIELLRVAELDALTGIYNKSKFNKDYQGLTITVKQQCGHLSIVMFDIDNFKELNDQYGHLVGDAVLLELANFIQQNIRSSDIFVRWGGDKFILTFPDTHLQLAVEIAEKLRVMIGEHSFEKIGHLSCSFGVAAFKEGDELDSLVRRADERLYIAKRQGKNKVV
ncbi:MAG: GGDEF domain-containing protein [Acetobacterium sp.]|nr:GGDEF domain-containing protein [Acetobacterium sp.]PKM74871.1 MAG: hypothetical protein CVU92_04320 [Firmicutes bacterium HGW-Firmicutes-17]